jgi:hypothetical protein
MYAQQMDKFEGVLNSLNMGADNVLDSTQTVGEQVEAMIKGFADDQKASSD